MKEKLKKFLVVEIALIAIIVIIIIINLFKYIYKFKIISEYQSNINELENYILEIDGITMYVKGKVLVQTNNDELYVLTDKENLKQYIISKNYYDYVEETELPKTITMTMPAYSFFGLTNSSNMWEILKTDMNIKLSKETYKDIECYRLEADSDETRREHIVYFDTNTKLPIAFKNNEKMQDIKISVGVVTDEDISVVALVNKVKNINKE